MNVFLLKSCPLSRGFMGKYEVNFKTTTLGWNERHTFSVASFRHLTRIIPIAEILSFLAD